MRGRNAVYCDTLAGNEEIPPAGYVASCAMMHAAKGNNKLACTNEWRRPIMMGPFYN